MAKLVVYAIDLPGDEDLKRGHVIDIREDDEEVGGEIENGALMPNGSRAFLWRVVKVPGTKAAHEALLSRDAKRDGELKIVPARRNKINLDALWQLTYNAQTIAFLDYLGFGDTNSDAFITWLAGGILDNPDSGVVEDLWTKMYFYCYEKYPVTGLATSRAEAYQWSCHVGPINGNGWGFTRPGMGMTISGTVTLSDATVGTGRTFTFSNAYFAGGGTGSGAWYVNGYIRWYDGNNTGVAKITSVTSSTVVVCEIILAFPSTTPSITYLNIPGPHPSDYGGQALALDGSSTTQIQDYVNVARVMTRWGYDKTALIAAQIARANYTEGRLNFHLAVRS